MAAPVRGPGGGQPPVQGNIDILETAAWLVNGLAGLLFQCSPEDGVEVQGGEPDANAALIAQMQARDYAHAGEFAEDVGQLSPDMQQSILDGLGASDLTALAGMPLSAVEVRVILSGLA